MVEENEFAHVSVKTGLMHGCGHDGHTTMLVGAAEYLARTRRFDGTAYLVFQPGEEGYAGAKAMIDDGLFERFPAEEVYAMHNWPPLPAGQIGLNSGPMMSSADRVDLDERVRQALLRLFGIRRPRVLHRLDLDAVRRARRDLDFAGDVRQHQRRPLGHRERACERLRRLDPSLRDPAPVRFARLLTRIAGRHRRHRGDRELPRHHPIGSRQCLGHDPFLKVLPFELAFQPSICRSSCLSCRRSL